MQIYTHTHSCNLTSKKVLHKHIHIIIKKLLHLLDLFTHLQVTYKHTLKHKHLINIIVQNYVLERETQFKAFAVQYTSLCHSWHHTCRVYLLGITSYDQGSAHELRWAQLQFHNCVITESFYLMRSPLLWLYLSPLKKYKNSTAAAV